MRKLERLGIEGLCSVNYPLGQEDIYRSDIKLFDQEDIYITTTIKGALIKSNITGNVMKQRHHDQLANTIFSGYKFVNCFSCLFLFKVAGKQPRVISVKINTQYIWNFTKVCSQEMLSLPPMRFLQHSILQSY